MEDPVAYQVQVINDGPLVVGSDEGVIYVIDRERIIGMASLIRMNKLLSDALERMETRFYAATDEILRLKRERELERRA